MFIGLNTSKIISFILLSLFTFAVHWKEVSEANLTTIFVTKCAAFLARHTVPKLGSIAAHNAVVILGQKIQTCFTRESQRWKLRAGWPLETWVAKATPPKAYSIRIALLCASLDSTHVWERIRASESPVKPLYLDYLIRKHAKCEFIGHPQG